MDALLHYGGAHDDAYEEGAAIRHRLDDLVTLQFHSPAGGKVIRTIIGPFPCRAFAFYILSCFTGLTHVI